MDKQQITKEDWDYIKSSSRSIAEDIADKYGSHNLFIFMLRKIGYELVDISTVFDIKKHRTVPEEVIADELVE